MNRAFFLFAFGVFFFGITCAPSPSPPKDPPRRAVGTTDAETTPPVDAGLLPCALYCAQFERYACREAKPTCESACRSAREVHLLKDASVRCVIAAPDRMGIQLCGDYCP